MQTVLEIKRAIVINMFQERMQLEKEDLSEGKTLNILDYQ